MSHTGALAHVRDDSLRQVVEGSPVILCRRLLYQADRQCRVDKAHLALAFLDLDGTVINADAAGIGWEQPRLARRCERTLCWKRMPPGEHVYGLGQKTSPLDKRGLVFQMWNTVQ